MMRQLFLRALLLLWCGGAATAAAPDAAQLVAGVAGSWAPLEAALTATMTTRRPDREPSVTDLRILRGGQGRTRIEFLSPERQRGKILLLLEDETWMYLPRPQRVVKVPLRHNPLSGSLLFEDLLPESFSEEGASVEETDDAYVLITWGRGKKKGSSDRIYFHRDTLMPFRREFHGKSGRLLKTIHVEETRSWKNVNIPWKIRFIDHLRGDIEAILEIHKAEELGQDTEYLFTREGFAPSGDLEG